VKHRPITTAPALLGVIHKHHFACLEDWLRGAETPDRDFWLGADFFLRGAGAAASSDKPWGSEKDRQRIASRLESLS
jgi:hypothetical protein